MRGRANMVAVQHGLLRLLWHAFDNSDRSDHCGPCDNERIGLYYNRVRLHDECVGLHYECCDTGNYPLVDFCRDTGFMCFCELEVGLVVHGAGLR